MCEFCKQPKCPPECPNYSHSRFYEQCHYCEGDIFAGHGIHRNLCGKLLPL